MQRARSRSWSSGRASSHCGAGRSTTTGVGSAWSCTTGRRSTSATRVGRRRAAMPAAASATTTTATAEALTWIRRLVDVVMRSSTGGGRVPDAHPIGRPSQPDDSALLRDDQRAGRHVTEPLMALAEDEDRVDRPEECQHEVADEGLAEGARRMRLRIDDVHAEHPLAVALAAAEAVGEEVVERRPRDGDDEEDHADDAASSRLVE